MAVCQEQFNFVAHLDFHFERSNRDIKRNQLAKDQVWEQMLEMTFTKRLHGMWLHPLN